MYWLRNKIISLVFIAFFAFSPSINLSSIETDNASSNAVLADKGDRGRGGGGGRGGGSARHHGGGGGGSRIDSNRSGGGDRIGRSHGGSHHNRGDRHHRHHHRDNFNVWGSWGWPYYYDNFYYRNYGSTYYNDNNLCFWYQDSFSNWYYSCDSYNPIYYYYIY